jgi:hypothetical protein
MKIHKYVCEWILEMFNMSTLPIIISLLFSKYYLAGARGSVVG